MAELVVRRVVASMRIGAEGRMIGDVVWVVRRVGGEASEMMPGPTSRLSR